MKNRILNKLREYAYFIWLVTLVFAAIFVTYYYDINKKMITFLLEKTFKNYYLYAFILALFGMLLNLYQKNSEKD